jgi:hypothetical protein
VTVLSTASLYFVFAPPRPPGPSSVELARVRPPRWYSYTARALAATRDAAADRALASKVAPAVRASPRHTRQGDRDHDLGTTAGLHSSCSDPGDARRSAEPPSAGGGYVDGSMFRAIVDDNQDVVEVNLDGPILQALAKSKSGDHDPDETNDLFAKLSPSMPSLGR